MIISAVPRLRPLAATIVVAAALVNPGRPAFTASDADVTWTNRVNASPDGSGLIKTAGCGGCMDAGGTSAQIIEADGHVEFVPSAGSRLYAGLGSNATASTDPALIDFAFSFWPDGGWDIRERNAYRKEGRFAPGDVFRIAVASGVVRYYQNGTLVFSSATAPPFPLVLDASLGDAGAGLVSARIAGSAAEPDPVPPDDNTTPSTYNAITDRVARKKGPLPALGGAGHRFSDPIFGSPMLRVTDRTTRPGAPDRSYRTPSGTHSNAWSADGRFFYAVSTDGAPVPYAFDPASMTAARLQPSTTGDGGLTLRFFNEPTFSYVTPGVLFGTYNGAGADLRSVDQYDLQSGQYSTLLDLDAVAPGLTGTYVGGVLSSAGPAEKLLVFFGGTSQDRHMKLVVFERGNPASRRLVDTHASTVDGVITNVPLNFTIHAAAIDRSGRYVTIYPTGADLQSPRLAAPAYVWDTVSNTFTATPLVQAVSGGHDAYGYGVRVNQDCCTSSTWDAAQWQFRSLVSPLITSDLIAPVLLPKEIYLADHPSWHNARPDRLVPFISATYRHGANTTEWRAWDEEILAVQSDAAGSGATVWRFAHHRSNTGNDSDPTRISFWYTPRINVSPDGRWALFTSNWEKTLGIDPRGEAGGAYRQDMFLIQLQQAAATPLPVAIAGGTLPGGTLLEPYAAALQATGGSGRYTWTIVGGALPQGLALDAQSGTIAGTPVTAGTSAFTVRAADAENAASYADAARSITIVDPAPPVPVVTVLTTSLPSARRLVPYSATLAASGGTAPLTWSIVSGALPTGLALDAATGVISGTPRQQGTWSFTVQAADASAPVQTATRSLSLRVTRK